jgi:hypothetical protein
VDIRSGFAAALDSSLNSPSLPVTEALDFAGKGGDTRAQLIMELLLHASQGQLPTFTHMLLGFNVEDGPEGAYHFYVLRSLQMSALT